MDNIILNDLKQRILEADDIVKLLKLRSENKKKNSRNRLRNRHII